jgi:hypothetical protein
MRSGSKGHTSDKEVHLSSGTVVKCADSKQMNARNAKGSCTVVTIKATVRAIPTNAAQVRHATSVA